MMYPVLARVRYEELGSLRGEWRLFGASLALNWLIGPALMFALAWLLLPNQPDANYAAHLEVRALQALGLKVADTVTYAPSLTAGIAATQAAVLRFKAQGITHVLGASVFFLEDAQ